MKPPCFLPRRSTGVKISSVLLRAAEDDDDVVTRSLRGDGSSRVQAAARSASWLPHTHTCRNVARIQNALPCVLGLVAAPRPGREAAERDETRLSSLLPPFVSRCTSGKQTVHGLVERPCIFRALCENSHPPFLPHSFSPPGCIRSRHRRFLLLPPSDQPSPRCLTGWMWWCY